MTIHADPEILGRRLTNHPPTEPDDDGLSTTTEPGDITCEWCRHALGINDIKAKDEKEVEEKAVDVRTWTVVLGDGGDAETVNVDADTIDTDLDTRIVTFSRDGQSVLGVPLVRARYWFAEDVELDKNVEAAKA